MTGAVISLAQFVFRLVVGVTIALALALLLALVRDDASFADNLRITLYLVGVVTLMLAFAGHSPTMRMGTIDPWLGSFFPKLTPELGKPYSGTTLSASAVLALTGIAVLALGVLVDSRL